MNVDLLTEEKVIPKEKGFGEGSPPIFIDKDDEDGDNGSNGDTGHPFGNSFIAMLLFLGADFMFFAGLIGAFLTFRFGAESWPPIGQPRLPIGVTGINTGILLLSGVLMFQIWRNFSNWRRQKIIKTLIYVLTFGAAFLFVQGYEWIRILEFGLKLSSGVFGASFYTLIGCHALHVFGAIIWLAIVLLNFKKNNRAFIKKDHNTIKLVGMYWFLVVGLWPILYGLVYLT